MSLAEIQDPVGEMLPPTIFHDKAVFIRTVRQGVPGSVIREAIDAMGDSRDLRELFVILLETTPGNLHRYYKRAALGRTESEEVLDTLRVIHHARTVFGDNDVAQDWLASPVPALAGEKPLTMCDTFLGRQLVREALRKIELGEFS
nr:MbcA/ParS/Xre antitoxin family protein [uncultured Halomonas sp.]